MKDLILASGDTTGMTLKYEINNVELTNMVISAPGNYLVSITGTTSNGDSYTTSVNVVIRPRVNIVLKLDIDLCCLCDQNLKEEAILEITDASHSIIPGTGQWFLGDNIIDPETCILSSDDGGKTIYYQVNTACGVIRSNAVEIVKCVITEINRPVLIPEVEGIETSVEPGMHYVFGHDDFAFTITPLQGYSLDGVTVKTNRRVWNELGGIEVTRVAEDTISVLLKDITVTYPLEVIIEGVRPTANTSIENTIVWTNGERLFIRPEKEMMLSVYTITGSLYTQQRVSAGETVMTLPPGVYIVILDGKTHRKVTIR